MSEVIKKPKCDKYRGEEFVIDDGRKTKHIPASEYFHLERRTVETNVSIGPIPHIRKYIARCKKCGAEYPYTVESYF